MKCCSISRRVVLAGFLLGSPLGAQNVNDDRYRFDNPAPAFELDKGPRVCIDEAHHNRHTATGRFAPYAANLRGDGFRVSPFKTSITRDALAACEILILGDPKAKQPDEPGFWAYPHAPAFSRNELDDLVTWVRNGGAVLLFADHAPGAGASAGLASVLGLQVFDGWARVNDQDDNPEMYARTANLFAGHDILDGNTGRSRIDSIAVVIAGAFFPSEQFEPLIVFGPEAVGYVRLGELGQQLAVPEAEWPKFRLAGWWLGGTRQWQAGRVVVFGDVTACTAQLYGPERMPVGMNHPAAAQNAQFCLNLVRWLARRL